MKYLLLLLISFNTHAKIFEVDLAIKKDIIPDSTIIDYQFEVTGKAKFKDSVRFEGLTKFFATAQFSKIKADALHMAGMARKVLFGDTLNNLTYSSLFYYNSAERTLYVPNLVVTGDSIETSLTINHDYELEKDTGFIIADAYKDNIDILLKGSYKAGKSLFIKRNGRKKVYVHHKNELITIKNDKPVHLIYDGTKWYKIL